MITLPTLPIPPTTRNPKTLLLYGAPKVGKTTAVVSLPGPYLLHDVDVGLSGSGSDYVNAVKIKSTTSSHYEQVLNTLKMENQKAGKPMYQFYVLDGLDTIEQWSEKNATLGYKKSVLGKSFDGDSVLELPKGGGYRYHREEFFRLLKLTMGIAPYVIFIGHLTTKYVVRNGDKITNDPRVVEQMGKKGEANLGVEVEVRDLSLTGKLSNMMCSSVDAIGYMYRNKQNKLMVSFNTDDDIQCGNRCEHLAGKTIDFNWKEIYVDL